MFEGESLKMKMLDLDVGFDRGAGEEIFHFDEIEFVQVFCWFVHLDKIWCDQIFFFGIVSFEVAFSKVKVLKCFMNTRF